MDKSGYRTRRSNFVSAGDTCAGTLFLPAKTESKPGVIILGHGFSAEKSLKLPEFADRFRQAGFAAYLFDYRCFGDSEGEPRHWVSPKRHLADWRAAIEHVRTLSDIDPNKIVIWGTSFGGGHVLRIAAENPSISAVISQVPHVDGFTSLLSMSPKHLVCATAAGIRDVFGSALFGKPYYSPAVGKVGEFAAMNSKGTWEGWYSILPAGSTWENKVLARIFLEIPFYSPVRSVYKIKVPTLIVAAEYDSLTPPKPARKAADKIALSEFHSLECDHFEPYSGEFFEQNIKLQIEFVKRHLGCSENSQGA